MTKWQRDFIGMWIIGVIALVVFELALLVSVHWMVEVYKFSIKLGLLLTMLLIIGGLMIPVAKRYADDKSRDDKSRAE